MDEIFLNRDGGIIGSESIEIMLKNDNMCKTGAILPQSQFLENALRVRMLH